MPTLRSRGELLNTSYTPAKRLKTLLTSFFFFSSETALSNVPRGEKKKKKKKPRLSRDKSLLIQIYVISLIKKKPLNQKRSALAAPVKKDVLRGSLEGRRRAGGAGLVYGHE